MIIDIHEPSYCPCLPRLCPQWPSPASRCSSYSPGPSTPSPGWSTVSWALAALLPLLPLSARPSCYLFPHGPKVVTGDTVVLLQHIGLLVHQPVPGSSHGLPLLCPCSAAAVPGPYPYCAPAVPLPRRLCGGGGVRTAPPAVPVPPRNQGRVGVRQATTAVPAAGQPVCKRARRTDGFSDCSPDSVGDIGGSIT